MKIRNQTIIETDTHVAIALKEPYWGAWKKYDWEEGVEGFGINLGIIAKAFAKDKKIRINLVKYGSYEISADKAMAFRKNSFVARDNKPIIVIPRTACKRIPTEQRKKEYEKKEYLIIWLKV